VRGSDGSALAVLPGKIIAVPSVSIFSKTFLKLDILGALELGLVTIIFTFTFVDLFDTVGTVVGLAAKTNIIDGNTGSFPKAGRVLCSDAAGTMLGALCGTSTVTTYIESASGVAEGGRTGLSAVTTGALFLCSVFLWPLATVIPQQATAPALIIVGLLMVEPVLKINLSDPTESLPAFLAMTVMPLTYSIANGLIFGILSYTVLKLASGKHREVSFLMYVLSAVFILYFVIGAG